MLRRFPSSDTQIGLLVAAFTLGLYLTTLSPSISPEDSGELAASIHVLGIPHPTGYPLFSLLGKAFCVLLSWTDLRVIVRLNLLGALLCGVAAFVSYRLFLALARGGLEGASFSERRHSREQQWAAAGGVLVLSFTAVIWSNAVSVEVYALHYLLATLTLLQFVTAMQAYGAGKTGEAHRSWLLFVYLLGLSFTNHMMTVLLIPGLLYALVAVRGLNRATWISCAQGVPVFFLGLSPYLYLPIRAVLKPVLNWGAPSDWPAFQAHVTGRMFQGQMFGSPDVFLSKLRGFLVDLPEMLGYLPVLLVPIGIWVLGRTQRRSLAFTGLIAATSLFYAFNYDFDDSNFLINALIMLAFWCTAGILALLDRFGSLRLRPVAWGVRIACALVVCSTLVLHYKRVDESGNRDLEAYVTDVLMPLEANATLLAGIWSHFLSPVLYLQIVEGMRPDVVVLNRAFLDYPWYYGELNARKPAFARPMDSELARAANPEAQVEAGSLMWSGIDHLFLGTLQVRPAYLAIEFGNFQETGFAIVPDGMAWRVFADSVPSTFISREVPLESVNRQGEHGDKIREMYARAHVNAAKAQWERGNEYEARKQLQAALRILPGYPEALEGMRWLRGY
jgi:hypothetical protein